MYARKNIYIALFTYSQIEELYFHDNWYKIWCKKCFFNPLVNIESSIKDVWPKLLRFHNKKKIIVNISSERSASELVDHNSLLKVIFQKQYYCQAGLILLVSFSKIIELSLRRNLGKKSYERGVYTSRKTVEAYPRLNLENFRTLSITDSRS